MKKTLSYLAILMAAVSCVYPYESALEGTQEDIMAFEGDIVVGGVSTIKISKVNSFADEWYNPYDKKGVAWIEDDQGGIFRSLDPGPANQFTIHTESAVPDRKYRMKAEVEGETYVSDWLKVLSPPLIEDIYVSQASDKVNVQVSVTMRGGDDATGYIGFTYEETWRFHTDYIGMYDLDTLRWVENKRDTPYPNYWCWKTESSKGMELLDFTEIGGNRVLRYPVLYFPRTDSRNHERYSIMLTAVTLPKETYRYLKNLDQISEGNNSLFSPNPGEMTSNIMCESDPGRTVLGYVTAFRYTSFRTFVNTKRFLSYQVPTTNYLFIPENRGEFKEDYENGTYPVAYMSLPRGENGEDVAGIYWGPLRCIDCVAAGGTLEKPDFWQ